MTKDEALRMALEALTNAYWPTESDLMPAHNIKECADAITAIREALAESEQEPVAWWNDTGTHIDLNVSGRGTPLYTHPLQRTWIGLKEEDDIDWEDGGNLKDLVKAIEAKLKEKNNG